MRSYARSGLWGRVVWVVRWWLGARVRQLVWLWNVRVRHGCRCCGVVGFERPAYADGEGYGFPYCAECEWDSGVCCYAGLTWQMDLDHVRDCVREGLRG